MVAAANANSADPKKSNMGTKFSSSKSGSVSVYNPTQFKKVGMGGDKAGKQCVAATGQPPPPPPMYPSPHLPPHHHAYQAWAAYRYAQQHSQYHGGPPPPPPGQPPPWNAEAYAAAHQAYAAAVSKTAGTTSKKGNSKKGPTVENGTVTTGSVGAAGAPALPPHHHYPTHNGPLPTPSTGPYRYSDTTLRRDALTRISTKSDNNKNRPNGIVATKGLSASSSLPLHNALSVNPTSTASSSVAKNGVVGGSVIIGANHTPSNPATLHMLELEARAEGATSPSQIEDFHREEVTTMGCTCKKTNCLKLYCQCFAVKIYCGANCRCMSCKNSPKYENERQDAIRAILSRNPTAFDTKFQKNKRKVVGTVVGPSGIISQPGGTNPAINDGTGGLIHGGLMDNPHARTISHKLGCKCRKSACIKKYCECYAGNVKCSSNCRCVGCKNMPPGGFGPPPPSANPVATNPRTNNKLIPSKNMMTTPMKKEPSWMMSAAQNLAFLKHSSTEKPKRIISRAPSEAGSMPSMSSSEESPVVSGSKVRAKPLSVNGARSIPIPNAAEQAAVDALKSSEKTAVNALLMAAVSMTEMAGDRNGVTNNENRHDDSTESGSLLRKSLRDTNHLHESSPEATKRSDDENFETPQRNLLKKFMSPKRKVSDRNAEERYSAIDNNTLASPKLPPKNPDSSFVDSESESEQDDEESPKRDHPGDETPSLRQKVKRSRLGSLKKGARLLDWEKSNGENRFLEKPLINNGVLSMEMSTPAKAKGGVEISDLTPVSARCIDFKKMRVNDSSSDPAVVDSVAL